MKFKRIISTFLAVLMLMSACAVVAGAEEGETPREYTYNTNNTTATMDYKKGTYTAKDGTIYTIETAEDKIAIMDYRYGNEDYELYVDAYSGEVALFSKKTGEYLFTNPYSAGTSIANNGTNGVKEEILSQLVVNYTDIASDVDGTYYSYSWAATRSQIIVKNIKGGIRVEYSIGREESRSLVPRQIAVTSFEEKILKVAKANMTNDDDGFTDEDKFYYDALASGAYFLLKDPAKAATTAIASEIKRTYPITKTMPIYVLDENLTEAQIKYVEQLLKTYCPDYSFEEMEEDHEYVGYEVPAENFPLFKMALEYTLDEQGLVVRLPANGIRFDETLYRLNYIDILPFMGAGTNPNPGYTFFPDGSGTLFDFEEIAVLGTRQLVTASMYGEDYAYHEVSGQYEEILRYPVFGLKETETFEVPVLDPDGKETGEVRTVEKDRGYVAIIEEGDSLMDLTSYHPGQTSEYNTVKVSVFPRPMDTYNVQDSISVGSNSEWTVVSSRKYTGNYKIRYIMLTDPDVASGEGYYEPSYMGMAKAYREYLEKKDVLTRLTADSVEENIPLYIETFGAMLTTEKYLSIPFEVMTPLTSFKNITTMYDELKSEGVQNINFIMSGYTKGGMTGEYVPYNLKWEKAVSKEMSFEELVAYAKQEGFGLFPDFDFVFASQNGMFDGLSLKKHAVKTIDNRYTSKREYSATKHTYISYFDLALSPAYYSHFYEKFIPKYQEYSPVGISVSTLGSYLNSDFDEDEPYNRDDNKEFTMKAFEYLANNLGEAEVMTSGGNAYCWKYVDHITDVALDSSRYSISSAAVPFLGIVLHGYVELAGTPINMEGNLDYAFLKSLENGASMKFVLSYQNTDNLKENILLSNYYSVRYDIWYDDVVSMYNELNELLKDVQTSVITKHEFVEGAVRIPDADELEADARKLLEEAIATEEALKNAAIEAERDKILSYRLAILYGTLDIKNANNSTVKDSLAYQRAEIENMINTDLIANILDAIGGDNDYTVADALPVLKKIYAAVSESKDNVDALIETYNTAKEGYEYLKQEGIFAEEHATFDAMIDAALDEAKVVVEGYHAIFEGLAQRAYDEIMTFDPKAGAETYVYTPAEKEEDNKMVVSSGTNYNADKNMVVYEVFDNGTAFLLNFNDYRVIIELSEEQYGAHAGRYAVDAYGYIVLSRVA